MFRAVVVNQDRRHQQGASTLTMQFVRMSPPTRRPTRTRSSTRPRTPRPQDAETKLAISLDKELGKQKILERYLNMAPLGNGVYGIFAAASSTSASRPRNLTLAESALLAGMVRSPSEFDPTPTA